jgi:hypothetical protein
MVSDATAIAVQVGILNNVDATVEAECVIVDRPSGVVRPVARTGRLGVGDVHAHKRIRDQQFGRVCREPRLRGRADVK